jgi:hypothetical protein
MVYTHKTAWHNNSQDHSLNSYCHENLKSYVDNKCFCSSFSFLCIICTMCMKQMHIGLVMSVCLSVRMIQLENRWMDLDEILSGHYAIGDYRKIVLVNFLQLVIPTWRTNKLVRCDQH